MCNLYKLRSGPDEVAKYFNAQASTAGANLSTSIFPGTPGLVVASSELRTMVWGFPLQRRSEKTGKPLKPKPVNNARADKLTGRFWNASFRDRRVLIPVSAFAEAEGLRGAKTRTLFSLPDQPIFACAGIWRASDEWGESYSMIMTDANETVAPIHNRMPVILRPDQYQDFLVTDADQALAMCVPYLGEMSVDRTAEKWV